jgi:tRNA A-37 threonylcarbamoyl transferase component Bud32
VTINPSFAAALGDRYRIERELGQGGMATVYLAYDLRHERKVAIKVLRPELAASIGPERFLREIRIAAQLQHPHVLPLLESGEAGGFLFYVMPYVDGESLRDRLARQGELPVHEAIKLIVEITDALSYAHRQGVVHRDIKPDNVMLSGRHALVVDFGVAKAVSEASGRNQLTTAGVALGTPAYMAPEQAAADPHLDHRVDIYAVGVMAYELLAGRPPFVGGSPQQILAAHVTAAPDQVSRHRPGISPALEAAVMRCLAKRPADRWQTADELLNQLEPLMTPSGGMTPTSTRPISGYQPVRSRRWMVAAAAVIGALGLGTTWILMGNRPASRPAVQFERTQLTLSGNAFSPAISEDGQRVAYVQRDCSEAGRCTNSIVVQDVGGAGAAVLLKGASALFALEWSADGRFIVFTGSFGSDNWGLFSLSTLGGQPRFLGCCEGNVVGDQDTVVIFRPPAAGDSVTWTRWVTIGDGMVGDSVGIPVAVRDMIPFPDGHRLVRMEDAPRRQLVIMDRKGQGLDSMEVSWQHILIGIAPGGAGVLMLVRQERSPDADIVTYRVDRDGRFDPRPDTVMRQFSANAGGYVSASGMLVYGQGPTDYSVWAMTRDAPNSLRFRERRLATGTGNLTGSLSPEGDRVLIWRDVLAGNQRLVQLSVMPFDSGPEVLLGPPRDFIDRDWTQDGRSILAGVRLSRDSVVLRELDASSGRSQEVARYAYSAFSFAETLPGGGYVLYKVPRTFSVTGRPGISDTIFHLPVEAGEITSFDPSPDGRSAVTMGWDPAYDYILVHRLSLVDGKLERLHRFSGEGSEPARWLSDGSILLAIEETSWELIWYRIPPGGGDPVRIGSAPRFPATYRFSQDGRRVLGLSQDSRSDVYLIRNFGDAFR